MNNNVTPNENQNQKKNIFSSRQDVNIYNPFLLNNNELNKNINPKSNDKNCLDNKIYKKNNIQSDRHIQQTVRDMKQLGELTNKNTNKKNSLCSSTNINKKKSNNLSSGNKKEEAAVLNSDKHILHLKGKTNTHNKKDNNTNNIFYEINKMEKSFTTNDKKTINKQKVLNISEFEINPENEQNERDKKVNLKKGCILNLNCPKNEKIFFDEKEQQKINQNANCKRLNTTKEINKFKQKNIFKKQNQINNDDKLFDDIIINDNEFNDDSKSIIINSLEINRFLLSKNPFIESNISVPNNKESSNKNKNGINSTIKSTNNQYYQLRLSTFGTNNKTFTTNTNTSNLSNTTELLNNNIPNQNINSSKKDSLKEFTFAYNEKTYKNLILLIKNGDTEHFLDIFEKNSIIPNFFLGINYKDENGNTMLHYSCDEGNIKIVEKLLNSNCDPNIKNNKNETPLHLASKKGLYDICHILLDNGASLDMYDLELNTPIHHACLNNHIILLKYLLTKNPQVDSKNINGKIPVDLATNKEITDLLEKYMNKNKNQIESEKNKYMNDKSSNQKIDNEKKEDSNNKRRTRSSFYSTNINKSNNYIKTKNELNEVLEEENKIKKTNTVLIKSENVELKNNSLNNIISSNISDNKKNTNKIPLPKETNCNNNEKKTNLRDTKFKEKNNEKKKRNVLNNKKNVSNCINDKSIKLNDNNKEQTKKINEAKYLLKISKYDSDKIDLRNLYNNTNINDIPFYNSKKNSINQDNINMNIDSNNYLKSENQKKYKKINVSTNIFINKNNDSQNKPKNIKINAKNSKRGEPLLISEQILNLNKTEDNINKVPKKSEILKSKNHNIKLFERIDKIINKKKNSRE